MDALSSSGGLHQTGRDAVGFQSAFRSGSESGWPFISVFIAASCNDFVSKEKGFVSLWDSLAKESEKKKYNKINLEKYGGVVDNYLVQFNNN